MIIICLSCKLAIRATDTSEKIRSLIGRDSDFWPDKYYCFSCGNSAHIYLEQELSPDVITSSKVINLNAEETFLALQGLGLPSEQNCCEETLDALFSQYGIKIKGKQHHGYLRYYIEFLELTDGTKVYFAPSAMGACIYRISKPYSYVKGVENENSC